MDNVLCLFDATETGLILYQLTSLNPMNNTEYNLHLKGYVGGIDFDRNYVDYVLSRNKEKPVNE